MQTKWLQTDALRRERVTWSMKNATSGRPDHALHLGPLPRGDWGDRAHLLDLRIRNLVADVADPVVVANVFFGDAPHHADLVSQVRDF